MKALFLVLAISLSAFAQVLGPDDLRDGVSLSIDPALVSDLLSIAQYSKGELEKGIRDSAKLKYDKKRAALRKVIDNVIDGSDDKGTELYMRSVLRKARLLDDIVMRSAASPEQYALSHRLLRESILWAIDLYVPEQKILNLANVSKTPVLAATDFLGLGFRQTQLMLDLYDLAPQHDTKVELARTTLKLLYGNINQDLVGRRAVSHSVTELVSYLNKIESQKPGNTLEGLALYREINDQTREILAGIKSELKEQGRPLNDSFFNMKSVPVLGIDEGKKHTYVGISSDSGVEWLRSDNTPISAELSKALDELFEKKSSSLQWYTGVRCVESTKTKGSICVGDSVYGSNDDMRATIEGKVSNVFKRAADSQVEIEIERFNGKTQSGYGIWNIQWLTKK